MINKLLLTTCSVFVFSTMVINGAESTMEFNGATTIHNGVTVSFSTGAFTNSSDGSLMDIYSNHPWATPINGGDDYKDISISSATYIFNITVAWAVNVQGLKLQFLNNNSVVKEITNFNAGGDIMTATVFAVNTTVDVIRFLDAGSSSSGGFELSHITFDLTLPVELTSFSAATIGFTVKLNWQTATEVNNYGFEIERKVHTSTPLSVTNWENIGFVNGNGNSNSTKNYNYEDNNLTAGKYAYKLKQIDNDGQFEYSKTIEVDLDTPKKFELSQNYPNPFNPSTTISFSLPESGNVKLLLYNILGEQVAELVNEYKEARVYTINFKASELNSGVYVYKISVNDLAQSRTMTLLK